MNIPALLFAVLTPLLLAAAPFAATAAERAPAPRAALAPVPGEVIVRFKADASVLRRHALAARSDANTVRNVLAQRASTLGQRVGRALEAGSDRKSVV